MNIFIIMNIGEIPVEVVNLIILFGIGGWILIREIADKVADKVKGK